MRIGGVADPSVDRVGAQEREVGAGVAGLRDHLAHRQRPVLVVATEDDRAGAVDDRRVGLQVDAGRIGEAYAAALGQLDQRENVVEYTAGGVIGVRAVEGDHQRPLVVRLPVRSVVQRVPAPPVVGLVGVDPADDQHRAAGGVRPDHDRDVALLAGRCPQQQQVAAGRPARGLDRRRRRPVDRGDHPVLGQDRFRLRLARDRR
jgi:hypothetical protein